MKKVTAAAVKNIDNLDVKPAIKLSVPLLASYLIKNYKQADIARLCNVSPQAVNDYIFRHYDELGPLIGKDDGLIAMKCKHVANKAMDRIDQHLDETTKKDLVALNIISGTHIDKYRLLNGQSTQNVSVFHHIICQADDDLTNDDD